MRPPPCPSASASRPSSSRIGCGSAATSIRAAECRSTCAGRPGNCPTACGRRTRESRPTAEAADFVTVVIVAVPLAERSLLAAMMGDYLAEMAALLQLTAAFDPHLDRYWSEPGERWPYWMV